MNEAKFQQLLAEIRERCAEEHKQRVRMMRVYFGVVVTLIFVAAGALAYGQLSI
jgi:hypothetical protein